MGDHSNDDAPQAGGRRLDAASQSGIETQLRSMFEQVASEPVPPRFLELLDKLEKQERDDNGGGTDGRP